MLATTEETHDGRRLRVAHLGSGPPVVLLHGYPDNLQIYCDLAPELARRCRVIAPDWPGMGRSEAWSGGASPVHMAGRLIRLLDSWNLERADIVAMDMGGQAALTAAARYPDRVRRLVVMNSLVFWDAPTSWEIRVLRRFGWNRIIITRFPRLVFRRAERTFLPSGVHLPGDLRRDLWSSFQEAGVRRYIVRMCAAYQGYLPRLPHLMPDLRCPTLVLWAENDAHFPVVHAERLHDALPDSRLEIVPGAQHWMVWHDAARLSRILLEFLGF